VTNIWLVAELRRLYLVARLDREDGDTATV